MERLLKAIIVVALLLLPWQYYFLPQIDDIRSSKQMVANIQGSLQRFADGREALFRSMLQVQRENIAKEKQRLGFLLPSFSKARANLMAPFDKLRTAVPGEWRVVPEGKFKVSGPLVFWPFKFSFTGSSDDAVKVLAHLESAGQFMRPEDLVLETHEDGVELHGIVELIFQNTDGFIASEGAPL